MARKSDMFLYEEVIHETMRRIWFPLIYPHFLLWQRWLWCVQKIVNNNERHTQRNHKYLDARQNPKQSRSSIFLYFCFIICEFDHPKHHQTFVPKPFLGKMVKVERIWIKEIHIHVSSIDVFKWTVSYDAHWVITWNWFVSNILTILFELSLWNISQFCYVFKIRFQT